MHVWNGSIGAFATWRPALPIDVRKRNTPRRPAFFIDTQAAASRSSKLGL